jgi:hypothetical protein
MKYTDGARQIRQWSLVFSKHQTCLFFEVLIYYPIHKRKQVITVKNAAAANIMSTSKRKVIPMIMLMVLSTAISLSGVFFIIYSILNKISFKVINTDVPGIFFGLAVLYLGIRYFISLQKLKKEVYKPSSIFSWSNFRRQKTSGKK